MVKCQVVFVVIVFIVLVCRWVMKSVYNNSATEDVPAAVGQLLLPSTSTEQDAGENSLDPPTAIHQLRQDVGGNAERPSQSRQERKLNNKV